MKKNRKTRPADPFGGALLGSPTFVEFDEWMDGELEKLVARWKHLAAPNASRITRPNRLPKRPK